MAGSAAGAVAFYRTGDPATGEFADAVVISAIGQVLSPSELLRAD